MSPPLSQALLKLKRSLAVERGAVAAEYSVLLALIIIAMLTVIQGLTGGITNTFQAIIDVLP